MKILFVSPSYKPAYVYGGPTVSVSELAEALVAIGHSVTVYTTTANGKEELEVNAGVPIIVNGVTVYYFKRQTGDHTHVSFSLWKKLWANATHFDVINLQSWWSLLIIGAAAICRLKQQKYVLSPRGMLSSYSFKTQNSGAKKIVHRLLGHYLLKQSYLHATTTLEWQDCHQVCPSWPGFVLPNLVRFPSELPVQNVQRDKGEPIMFGFLSRIDPKKGLELFFQAVAKADFDFRIKIAGEGEASYVQSLQSLAKTLHLEDKVDWCGWMKGDEKFIFLQSIDVFVLTSYNENFANTVIEALAVGTPVLLSKGVGLADFVEENSLGWICDTHVSAIYSCIQKISKEQTQFDFIRRHGPAIVEKEFNQINLAIKYSDAYGHFAEKHSARKICAE